MPGAHAERAWRRPWVRLGLAAAALAGSVAFAIGGPEELGIGSLRLSAPAKPGALANAELAVTLRAGPDRAVDSRIFRVTEAVVSAQLESDPAIVAVRPLERPHEIVLIADFGDASDAERQEAVLRLDQELDPGALRSTVGGEVQQLIDDRQELTDDLWRAELLVLPVALLIGALALGWRAAAPALCAAIAIAGSLALLRVAGLVADVSLLGFAPAAAVGLVLGIELPLRLLRSPPAADDARARSTLTIAAAASLPALAGLATPLDQAASLALGCAIAALLAAGAALLVVPAIVELTAEAREPARTRRSVSRGIAVIGLALGVAGSCALAVAAVIHGETASYAALDAARSLAPMTPSPEWIGADSLFPELPIAAAVAAAVLALALAVLAHNPWGLLLGPLSLLPAAAAVGVCALLAEYEGSIGRSDAGSTFLDTGSVAVALCAIATVAAARSAAAALDLRDARRPALAPTAGATLIGVLAGGAMIPAAPELGIALAAGLILDLVCLRLPLWALGSRRVGSGPWPTGAGKETGSAI